MKLLTVFAFAFVLCAFFLANAPVEAGTQILRSNGIENRANNLALDELDEGSDEENVEDSNEDDSDENGDDEGDSEEDSDESASEENSDESNE